MKILVNENQFAVSTAIEQVNEAIEAINGKLKPALEAINVELTNESLKDYLKGASSIKKDYFKSLKTDLEKVKTPALKKDLAEKGETAWNELEQACNQVRREIKHGELLTVENGSCVMTDENREILADSQRIYITDPKQIAAYQAHLKAVEALNELFAGNIPLNWFALFPQLDGTFSRNENTDYESITREV